MKIRPLGVELFHADCQTDRRAEGQADVANLTVAFRNFAVVPLPPPLPPRMEHVRDYIVEIHLLKSYRLQVNLKLSFSITNINSNSNTPTGYRDKALRRFVVLFGFHCNHTMYESHFYLKGDSTRFVPALSIHYDLLQVL
jgi:hypothetical protein